MSVDLQKPVHIKLLQASALLAAFGLIALIAVRWSSYQWDFHMFYGSATDFLQGTSPYRREGLSFYHPPLSLYLYGLFAQLPRALADELWLALKIAALGAPFLIWNRNFLKLISPGRPCTISSSPTTARSVPISCRATSLSLRVARVVDRIRRPAAGSLRALQPVRYSGRAVQADANLLRGAAALGAKAPSVAVVRGLRRGPNARPSDRRCALPGGARRDRARIHRRRANRPLRRVCDAGKFGEQHPAPLSLYRQQRGHVLWIPCGQRLREQRLVSK